MDLAGLVSMLECNALWFTKVGFLQDPYEGVIPKALRTYRDKADEEGQFTLAGKELVNATEFSFYARSMVLVNCWHKSDSESAAMWAIYGTAKGFAVSTTVERLSSSLNANQRGLRVNRVAYLDYEMPDPDIGTWPWLMKRSAFAYEQEVRVWTDSDESGGAPQGIGALIDVNVSTLIESLFLSPHADPWLGELTAKLLKRYSVGINVIPSTLYSKPKEPLPRWCKVSVEAQT
jgi:hypothetical protein